MYYINMFSLSFVIKIKNPYTRDVLIFYYKKVNYVYKIKISIPNDNVILSRILIPIREGVSIGIFE